MISSVKLHQIKNVVKEYLEHTPEKIQNKKCKEYEVIQKINDILNHK